MKKSVRTVVAVLSAAAVLVLSAAGLSACGSAEKNTETKSLYEQGLEIVELMSEMTRSEEYVQLYTGSSEIQEIVQNINVGGDAAPKAVYAISVDEDGITAMLEMGGLNHVSEGLRSLLVQKPLTSLMTQINAMSGVEELAAASTCMVTKTFVNEEVKENVIYLYTYEDAVPAAVTFLVGEDHAVFASGLFVLNDGFSCGSAEEIQAFFSYIGVEVTEVFPE
ncbi:MAG: hypothetical protein NC409_00010 [Clostridium sp.]|nr:hypothetical protein [Clostridium sp.]